jgi:beta-1,2-mannobiose phosphorylase / 1,2-beta-oligomannan phosphorylase
VPDLDFNVEEVTPLKVEADALIKDRDLFSPYVWQEAGKFCMLVRSAPRTLLETGDTGAIHYGESQDGLLFHVHSTPLIAPSTPLDIGGCEDPTLVRWKDEYIVYYTGVDATRRSGQMLYASGPSIHQLTKRGVALASSKSEGNTKEATVERTSDGHWRLFYEYARDGASLIGVAVGEGVGGPWHEQEQPFAPRPGLWDNWHLSPGPLLTSDPDLPVMFYNGATIDARWRIGWVAFKRDCLTVVDRCIEPLITPPPPENRADADIAFAASVVAKGGDAHLYFSRADQLMFRAIIRRTA